MNATRNLLTSVFVVAILLVNQAKADFAFGTPTNLGSGINSSVLEFAPRPSADGLALYFQRMTSEYDEPTLWMVMRATKQDPWGVAVCLGPCTDSSSYQAMGVVPSYTSADGLEVYFSDMRPGGYGGQDLWMMTRKTIEDPWNPWVNLGAVVNSSADEQVPALSPDGLELYFSGWRDNTYARAGGYGSADLWVTKRATRNDPWGEPVNLGPAVNTAYQDARVTLSVDGLSLFFDSQRPGGYGEGDLYMAKRANLSAPWGQAVNLGPVVNSPAFEEAPCISADGSTLYYDCNRLGGWGGSDIWQAPILPIVDFNSDGKVDIQDLLILIEHWGTSDTLCDIGPMPWGDGKVDEKDLEVLMRYWGQEVNDPRLAASWKLDETAGMMAADSVGANNGTLVGNPIWQPAGGKLGGALQFDGIDDYVKTPFVVDPAQGPFSVFAWVKGGGPGQVILSQTGGANWLMAGAPVGVLMTDLKSAGRQGKPLTSATVITDGAWHRVGLVWDGSNRILYLDDIEVAKDTQANLPSSPGGLYIGAGSKLAAGTFWSGLIDDVRIYDRVVTP